MDASQFTRNLIYFFLIVLSGFAVATLAQFLIYGPDILEDPSLLTQGKDLLITQIIFALCTILVPGLWLTWRMGASTKPSGRPKPWWFNFGAALLFPIAMPFMEFVMWLWFVLMESLGFDWVSKMQRQAEAAGAAMEQLLFFNHIGWAITGFVTISILPGVAEELMFRGGLQRLISRYWNPRAGLVISALLFASMHMMPLQIPYLFVGGLMLGWGYRITGHLWVPILGHALHNGLVYFAIRMTGPGQLNQAQEVEFSMMALAGILASGSLALVLYNRLREHTLGSRQ